MPTDRKPQARHQKSTKSKPNTVKSPPPKKQAKENGAGEVSPEHVRSQQRLLDVFQRTFYDVLSSPDFSSTLQEVKQALYNRDFARAFGREEYLDVYAARWSPTRALGYAAMLKGLRDYFQDLAQDQEGDDAVWPEESQEVDAEAGANPPLETSQDTVSGEPKSGDTDLETMTASSTEDDSIPTPLKTLKILSLGGGTAELSAVSSFVSTSLPHLKVSLTLLDSGPWGPSTTRLYTSLTTPPPLSKYASAAARASQDAAAFIPSSRLDHTFQQRDVLALETAELETLLGGRNPAQPALITLLFTLNELYNSPEGIRKTTALLRRLSGTVAPGTLLLVVDSPGSYSEAAVGKGGEGEKKRYPMHWLLDRTLLGADGRGNGKGKEHKEETKGVRWEKLEENDSIWFRVPDELRYPIPLENMRYQLHLYRAV